MTHLFLICVACLSLSPVDRGESGGYITTGRVEAEFGERLVYRVSLNTSQQGFARVRVRNGSVRVSVGRMFTLTGGVSIGAGIGAEQRNGDLSLGPVVRFTLRGEQSKTNVVLRLLGDRFSYKVEVVKDVSESVGVGLYAKGRKAGPFLTLDVPRTSMQLAFRLSYDFESYGVSPSLGLRFRL